MSRKNRLFVEPITVILVGSILVVLGFCGEQRKIDYQTILTDKYSESVTQTFSIGAGCQGNRITRQVSVDKKISLQYAKDNPLTIPEQLTQQFVGEIYGKLRTQENVNFGQTDTYTVELTNDCKVPRTCYISEKSRFGVIGFVADDKTTTEANFSVPVSADIKCVETK